jgi:hypothetical protein
MEHFIYSKEDRDRGVEVILEGAEGHFEIDAMKFQMRVCFGEDDEY